MDWVYATMLLQDSFGALIKLELTKVSDRNGYAKHVLTPASCELILEALGESGLADEDEDD